ncbi:hypothetical protein D3C86_1495020 [compost metagenome]
MGQANQFRLVNDVEEGKVGFLVKIMNPSNLPTDARYSVECSQNRVVRPVVGDAMVSQTDISPDYGIKRQRRIRKEEEMRVVHAQQRGYAPPHQFDLRLSAVTHIRWYRLQRRGIGLYRRDGLWISCGGIVKVD